MPYCQSDGALRRYPVADSETASRARLVSAGPVTKELVTPGLGPLGSQHTVLCGVVRGHLNDFLPAAEGGKDTAEGSRSSVDHNICGPQARWAWCPGFSVSVAG